MSVHDFEPVEDFAVLKARYLSTGPDVRPSELELGLLVMVRVAGSRKPVEGIVTGVMRRPPHLVRVALDGGRETWIDRQRVSVQPREVA